MKEKIIYTIGHSDHSIERFIGLLKRHEITAVADVRSVPYSGRYKQFNKDTLAKELKKEDIAYVFLGEELGGRPKEKEFYKDGIVDFGQIAESDRFKKGLERVVKGGEKYRIALMCAEKDPLKCHRTILVCRYLKDMVGSIRHILYDGNLEDYHFISNP